MRAYATIYCGFFFFYLNTVALCVALQRLLKPVINFMLQVVLVQSYGNLLCSQNIYSKAEAKFDLEAVRCVLIMDFMLGQVS